MLQLTELFHFFDFITGNFIKPSPFTSFSIAIILFSISFQRFLASLYLMDFSSSFSTYVETIFFLLFMLWAVENPRIIDRSRSIFRDSNNGISMLMFVFEYFFFLFFFFFFEFDTRTMNEVIRLPHEFPVFIAKPENDSFICFKLFMILPFSLFSLLSFQSSSFTL